MKTLAGFPHLTENKGNTKWIHVHVAKQRHLWNGQFRVHIDPVCWHNDTILIWINIAISYRMWLTIACRFSLIILCVEKYLPSLFTVLSWRMGVLGKEKWDTLRYLITYQNQTTRTTGGSNRLRGLNGCLGKKNLKNLYILVVLLLLLQSLRK